MQEETKQVAFHWLVVGYVSPGAEQWIKDVGGQVRIVSEEPRLLAVAIAYATAGAWTWSHGEQQHRQGVELWSSGEIQEASTGITLQYRSHAEPRTLAEYCSVEGTYLILPDEEFDLATGAVKEPSAEAEEQPQECQATESSTTASDFDDHPF